jgi:hypothetical protein
MRWSPCAELEEWNRGERVVIQNCDIRRVRFELIENED